MADSGKSETKPVDNWQDMKQITTRMLLNPAVTKDAKINYYNLWAQNGYDKSVQEAASQQKYEGFSMLQQSLHDLFPAEDRHHTVILDIGAGTGLCGQSLRDVGFAVLDGLDPAEEMLRVAQEKNIYRHTYTCYLTEQPTTIPANSYDCAIMVGVMGHSCLPCSAFIEITRLVKPGGYIVNCMCRSYLKEVADYSQNWEPLRTRMETEGRWKVLRMDPYPNHHFEHEGLLMVIQVLK